MAGSLYIAYVILNFFTDVIYNKRYIFLDDIMQKKCVFKEKNLKISHDPIQIGKKILMDHNQFCEALLNRQVCKLNHQLPSKGIH